MKPGRWDEFFVGFCWDAEDNRGREGGPIKTESAQLRASSLSDLGGESGDGTGELFLGFEVCDWEVESKRDVKDSHCCWLCN